MRGASYTWAFYFKFFIGVKWMLDIKRIRADREGAERGIRAKEGEADLSELLAWDEKIRQLKTEVQELKEQRNQFSKKIGELKRKGEDASQVLEEVSGFSDKIHEIDREISDLEVRFTHELAQLPNLPMDDIKESPDPADNVMIKEVGQKPVFDFEPKNHLELDEKLQVFDFKRGAKISGTGWPVYQGWGARLEWALINYMLSIHIRNGYTQWIPPLLVRPETEFGSGQLPKFADQQFRITDDDYDLYLIPTAEVPLNGLHMDEILPQEELPKRYVAYTPCFRREAGAAGEKERGLIRVHQFNKVELFCLTHPEQSSEVFEQMLAGAEQVLEGLGLHYRNMLLVTGDMSFCSARTVDIEVWLPGQNRYYEVSSVSNCTDYQARRSKIRFRPEEGKNPEFVHTLNGSGLATARLMVALLENNQQADGSVIIPEVLRPYLDGKERLVPGEVGSQCLV